MRFPLLAVLATLALLVPPSLHAAEPKSEARQFLRTTLGQETLRALDRNDRRNLRRYAESLLSSPPGHPTFTRCFAPDTDPTLLNAYHALEEAAAAREPDSDSDDPQPATQFDDKWDTTATNGNNNDDQGLPITLTWSIVPDGTDVPGDSGIGDLDAPSDLRAFLATVYGGSAGGDPQLQPYFTHLQTVFDNITAKTGVTYVYEENDDGAEVNTNNDGILGVRGDIRIAGHDIDGNSSTLGYNYFPDRGDMVIDTNDDWFATNAANFNAFTNLVEHETGHGLGLKHVCPNSATKLMEPLIRTSYRGLRFDDIYSLNRHYGDFYEKHSTARNNDNYTNAAPITASHGSPFGFEWLSIDDDDDIDYYSLNLIPGTTVTIRAIPSTEIYPEGPQNPSCSASSNFDSTDLHNLTLDLIAPNQSTTLASGAGTPAGQSELITNYTTNQNGTHYIRINGDNTNGCQLYRLEVEVFDPSAAVDLTDASLAQESFAGQNGIPDPGETVRYDLTLTGLGSITATNIQSTLTGPTEFTGFSTTHNFGTLNSSETAKGSFIFALDDDCGESVTLNLNVTADGGYAESFPLTLTLGTTTTILTESADASANLPAGWSSSATGSGSGWAPTTAQAASPTRSFFAADVGSLGTSSLESPPLLLGTGTSTLSFNHLYNTEPTFDGGVLEISIDSGVWQDILAAGGSFTSNGYTDALNSGFSNPLPGRQAWTGNSALFVNTTAILPSSAAGQSIRLRWRMGHDDSASDVGWYIDDITLDTPTCDTVGPTLTLSTTDTSADEFASLDTASITLSTPLPTLFAIPAILQNSGSADLILDVSGLSGLNLPAGQASHTVAVTALSDGLPEGPETLDLTLLGGSGSALLNITDSPYSQWAFTNLGSGPNTGPYDDFENDGLSNIEEYTRQLNPSTPNLAPDLNPTTTGNMVRIDAPFATLPPDVALGAETSLDLLTWTTTGVQSLPDGFQISLGDPVRFIRLTFQSIPTAP